MLKTRLTELLKIKYPIIQSPMAWVSYPPLVAAVSEAGGLGILGAGRMGPDELRRAIREVREHTRKPFGVNVTATSPIVDQFAEVVVEEKVPVASYGRGNPGPLLQKCQPEGIVCLPTIGAVSHALKAEQDGADAVIAQGLEAGGHCSYIATMVLVPLVVRRVKIPVAAAGGLCDGRGLVAALALGAEGIGMGTRFIPTRECPIPLHVKQLLVRSGEDDAQVTPLITGTRCRGLRSRIVELLEEKGEKALEVPQGTVEHASWGSQRMRSAFIDGDTDMGFVPCGQVVGLIEDIPTCRELIERTMREAEEALAGINARFDRR